MPSAEMLEAASERLEALKQDGRVVSETLVRLDGEVGELTRADHDYEQVCGAIGMIDTALGALHSSQRSLLDAIRLQAFSRTLYSKHARHAQLRQRRWLRELTACELAFEEVCARAEARDVVEQELVLYVSVDVASDGKSDVESLDMNLRMSDDATMRAICADIAAWGDVVNHDDELQLELRSTTKRPLTPPPPPPRAGRQHQMHANPPAAPGSSTSSR